MMQQRERANGIGGSVEDQLRPLSPARILERDAAHAAAIEKVRESFDEFVRRAGGLKRSDPGIAIDVKAHMAGFDDMSGRKRRASNHVFDVLGEDFLVANAVLHGTHRTGWTEDLLCLLDRGACVCAFCGHDAEITSRNL